MSNDSTPHAPGNGANQAGSSFSSLKPPLTIQEQRERLQERGLDLCGIADVDVDSSSLRIITIESADIANLLRPECRSVHQRSQNCRHHGYHGVRLHSQASRIFDDRAVGN